MKMDQKKMDQKKTVLSDFRGMRSDIPLLLLAEKGFLRVRWEAMARAAGLSTTAAKTWGRGKRVATSTDRAFRSALGLDA